MFVKGGTRCARRRLARALRRAYHRYRRPPAERLPDHMRRWLEEFAPETPRRSLHHRLPCALPSSKSLFNGLPTTNFDECCPHNPEAASLGFPAAATAGRSVRGMRERLRPEPKQGGNPNIVGSPRPRHRRYGPRPPPLVPSRTVPRSTSDVLADARAVCVEPAEQRGWNLSYAIFTAVASRRAPLRRQNLRRSAWPERR
jgi:hypothetical protein